MNLGQIVWDCYRINNVTVAFLSAYADILVEMNVTESRKALA